VADIRDDGSTSDDADDLIDIYVTAKQSEGASRSVKKNADRRAVFRQCGRTADTLGLVRKFRRGRRGHEFTAVSSGRSGAIRGKSARDGRQAGHFDFNDWAIIDVQYVIKGNFQLADDKLTVQFRLYNVPERQ
jgi:hypothetical protein